MASSGAKAARIQSQGSSLNVFWSASTLPTASILAAIARLNPRRRIARRPAGRHAAPSRGRTPPRRHAAS